MALACETEVHLYSCYSVYSDRWTEYSDDNCIAMSRTNAFPIRIHPVLSATENGSKWEWRSGEKAKFRFVFVVNWMVFSLIVVHFEQVLFTLQTQRTKFLSKMISNRVYLSSGT